MNVFKLKFGEIFRKFRNDQQGVVMTEALVVIPFLTLLSAGLLEFGNLFWQKEQIETGLRDAARYMARCPHSQDICEGVARNLAYFGTVDASGSRRVTDWTSNIGFQTTSVAGGTYETVTASTDHLVTHSVLLNLIQENQITVFANHHQRIIGR